PRDEPEVRLLGGRFRADILVACGIALFAGGLLFSAINKVRARNEMLACQNTLRTLHTGLTGYADTHGGYYPQVAPNTTAHTFVNALTSTRQIPAGFPLPPRLPRRPGACRLRRLHLHAGLPHPQRRAPRRPPATGRHRRRIRPHADLGRLPRRRQRPDRRPRLPARPGHERAVHWRQRAA